MRIAYFDCFSGISGDMTIAAFLDAGLPMRTLSEGLGKLGLDGYSLKKARVMRGAIAGTKFDCVEQKKSSHNHRSLRQILRLIDSSGLNGRVKACSKDIFETIGAAEAKVHGIRPGADVHLHELGQLDSIIDIVGTAIAIDALGIDEVRASRLSMGRTTVATAHGVIPIPGPATLELLKGVPLSISELGAETVTPTGAGIVKTLAKSFGPTPVITLERIGYGAGSRDLEGAPNMLRLIVGRCESSFKTDTVSVIETNIDDMNPQFFEYLFTRLFDAGALDVYTTTIAMKKARPAVMLTAICRRQDLEKISSIIFGETTTIGVRFYEADRLILNRRVIKARTRFGDVKVKVSGGSDGIRTISPEYEDCVRIAASKRIALKTVYDAAKAAKIVRGSA